VLWVPITIGAAALQVARNGLQRGLLGAAGPWGATLVRFLFGLPFSALFVAAAVCLSPGGHPLFGAGFLLACLMGGAAQILATAAMLVSMRRSSFALGTVFQQSGIPLAAVFGVLFGDHLRSDRWLGLGLVTAALAVLAWPRRGTVTWSAAPLGLAAGAGFALAANAYRQGALALDRDHPVLAAQITLLTVQAMQSVALVAWLALTDRGALTATMRSWRTSLAAGLFGAVASSLWFTAFALAPAGPVRAVGVVEAPIAGLAGRRLFAERLEPWQWLAVMTATLGVGLAAFG
jgi:drug/metabolite transporter (DMT)-like permease